MTESWKSSTCSVIWLLDFSNEIWIRMIYAPSQLTERPGQPEFIFRARLYNHLGELQEHFMEGDYVSGIRWLDQIVKGMSVHVPPKVDFEYRRAVYLLENG